MNTLLNRYLKTREIAALLGVGERTVKHYLDTGRLKYTARVPSGCRLVFLPDLLEWAESNGFAINEDAL